MADTIQQTIEPYASAETAVEILRDWTRAQIAAAMANSSGFDPSDLLDALLEKFGLTAEQLQAILAGTGDGSGSGSGSAPAGGVVSGVARSVLNAGADFTQTWTETENTRPMPAHGGSLQIGMWMSSQNVAGYCQSNSYGFDSYPKNLALYGTFTPSLNGVPQQQIYKDGEYIMAGTTSIQLTSQTVVPEDGDTPEMIVAKYDIYGLDGQKAAVLRLEVVPGCYWNGNEWTLSPGCIGIYLYLEQVLGDFFLDYFNINFSWPKFPQACDDNVWTLTLNQPVGALDEFTVIGDFAVEPENLLDGDYLQSVINEFGMAPDTKLTGSVQMKFSRYSNIVRVNCYFDEDKIFAFFGDQVAAIAWAVGSLDVGVLGEWDGNILRIKLQLAQLMDMLSMRTPSFVDLKNYIAASFIKYMTPSMIIKTEVQNA